MRTMHELLIILRDNTRVEKSWFGLKQRICSGLCNEINSLQAKTLITPIEEDELRGYVYNNRPNKDCYNGWYWERTLWKPRLKWLNEHINKTKSL